MENPRVRFWIICVISLLAAITLTLFSARFAKPLLVIFGLIGLIWVLHAHARQSGGWDKPTPATAATVAAGTALAVFMCSALGFFIAIGSVTGFAD